jgi:formamidopyrimidine-DNA glycosylase
MRLILERAIESQGDSFSDFRNIYGERGKFQNFAKVYGKDGENCPNCGNIIVKSKVGGRGTFYCPKCQTLRK